MQRSNARADGVTVVKLAMNPRTCGEEQRERGQEKGEREGDRDGERVRGKGGRRDESNVSVISIPVVVLHVRFPAGVLLLRVMSADT